jgi:hypothetical protein
MACLFQRFLRGCICAKCAILNFGISEIGRIRYIYRNLYILVYIYTFTRYDTRYDTILCINILYILVYLDIERERERVQYNNIQ